MAVHSITVVLFGGQHGDVRAVAAAHPWTLAEGRRHWRVMVVEGYWIGSSDGAANALLHLHCLAWLLTVAWFLSGSDR